MLLTITCEAENATDLGYLLHKNPASLFQADLWFGSVRVFYPLTGWLLNPMLASAAMAVSSVSVITNPLRLRRI